jgi:hypothetical protein
MQALPDRQSVKAAVSTTAVTTATAAAAPRTEDPQAASQTDAVAQHSAKELGQAALLQKLRQEAYEVCFDGVRWCVGLTSTSKAAVVQYMSAT